MKVSVIIPTFNRAAVLEKTLESVMAQTIKDWECIVVDDGSDDGTDTLMWQYVERDSRFKYFHRPESRMKGASSCRNIGLEHSKGDFIQFLDSDDLISANKLEAQLRVLEVSDANAIATCKWGFFRTNDEPLRVAPYRPTYISTGSPLELLNVYSKHSTYLPQHAFLVRKCVIDSAGYWNESLSNNDDTEFFARVLLCCSEVVFVPLAEVYYRVGVGNNLGSLSSEAKVRSAILSWKLVDAAIEKKSGISNHDLVRVGRTEIFHRIREQYPELVREYQEFFHLRRSNLEHLYIKLLSRFELLYLEQIKARLKFK